VLLDHHKAMLPSRFVRHHLMWLFAFFAVVIEVVLLGVLGHFESTPSNIYISDRLFKATFVIVAFILALPIGSCLFFGFQFVRVIKGALDEMEKQSTITTTQSEGSDQAIQIRLIID